MKTNSSAIVTAENALLGLPSAEKGEVFTDLLKRPGLRIERIVSAGQASPLNFHYDQKQAEWVILLQGFAELELELGGQWQRQTLTTGSYVSLPAGCRHRINSTSIDPVTVWLAVFFDDDQGD